MAAESHSSNHDHADHHIIPIGTYLKVFAALIVLTVITVAASKVDFGHFNAAIAFAIASVKAGLVLAIFMHLKYDNMLNRVIIGSAVFFLIILWLFSILDIVTRIQAHSPL